MQYHAREVMDAETLSPTIIFNRPIPNPSKPCIVSECFDGKCVAEENICVVETFYVEGSSWTVREVEDIDFDVR